MIQVKLAVLRKIFLASQIVNTSLGFKSDETFKAILSTNEDALELETMENYF